MVTYYWNNGGLPSGREMKDSQECFTKSFDAFPIYKTAEIHTGKTVGHDEEKWKKIDAVYGKERSKMERACMRAKGYRSKIYQD